MKTKYRNNKINNNKSNKLQKHKCNKLLIDQTLKVTLNRTHLDSQTLSSKI